MELADLAFWENMDPIWVLFAGIYFLVWLLWAYIALCARARTPKDQTTLWWLALLWMVCLIMSFNPPNPIRYMTPAEQYREQQKREARGH
jgi:hypothetical protein